MVGWISENSDYLFFTLICLAVFGLLEVWLRRRSPHGRMAFWVPPVALALLVIGWFFVNSTGRTEGKRIQSFLEWMAPTYAQELSLMGHARLTLSTPADDPAYLAMIEATKRWKTINPVISDVYTFRRVDGKVRLIVSSETDYNHDGKYSGTREQRIPIGREYPEADEGMLRALDGQSTFSNKPVRDEWGVWVSAQVPMRDAQGRVEAALGVDYPAKTWVEAIARVRQQMMWFWTIPMLVLGFGAATTGVLRAEMGARRLIEMQLRGSEAHLRTTIDNIPFDFWVMDGSGRYVLINATSRQHWGDVTGKTAAEAAPSPEILKTWEDGNRRAFAGELVRGEVTFEIEGKKRHFYNVIAPVRVDGKIGGILGLNIDMTERVSAENALRRSERRFALHVRQTPLAVIEWDMEFRVKAWNPAAEAMFGYSAGEAIGRDAVSLIVPEEVRTQVMDVWRAIVAHSGGTRSTNKNITKKGRIILCEWYDTPLVDDNGQVIGVASLCQDITDRDALEKQVLQTQKIESLGQLAAGVAHEFNNLLTPMLLRLEMLRNGRANDPALLKALRSIEDAIEQAAQLNQRILAVGQRSSGKRELLALNPIVDDTINLLRHTFDRRIELSLKLAPGLGPLSLDRAHVSQIIVNLAINARDAVMAKIEAGMPTAWTPRIDISTMSMESASRGGAGVSMTPFVRVCQRLTVSDNGIGMVAEVKERIFEPFYTTKAPGQGTGLGLAVVWNVTKNLGGWIELESQPGQGATFHVYFPVPDLPSSVMSPVAGADFIAATATGQPVGKRILLVEDNVIVAETINALLTQKGYEVVYAQNGEEAWELFHLREHGFDLILTDESMPVLSGTELVRRVRKAGHQVRIVIVSGYLGAERLDQLKRLGVDGILHKPFAPKDLFALLG